MIEQSIGVQVETDERVRKSKLLNILILSLAVTLIALLTLVLILQLSSMASNLISIVVALVICGISFLLNRFGKFRPAAYLFLAGFIAVACTSTVLPNITVETRIVGPIFYSFSVLVAGFLITPIAAFWFAGFGTAILLVVVMLLGGPASFTVTAEPGLGVGVIAVPVVVSFVLAGISWLFGNSINDAFSALAQRSEKLQASEEELRAANEELQASEEELRTANEELREAQEQLVRSERLAAIGQLAGGVGHELRNPLGAIKNAIYYVKGKVAKSELAQKDPRVTQFLEIVDDEINTSNKIINDLLGFSRVGKPAVSPTQIKKVIEDALARVPVPENIELTQKPTTDSTEIEVDSDQIQQVLINIITNAVQAMPDGGKLTIGTKEKGGFLEVEISDTGSGMPKEVKDKIFEPLFTTRAKGIGLGLAVTKSIIDRHGGNIEVKSKEGEGTTVNIKLPLKTI